MDMKKMQKKGMGMGDYKQGAFGYKDEDSEEKLLKKLTGMKGMR